MLDVLKDDYFIGSKLGMKVNHIKGVVLFVSVCVSVVEFES